MTARWKAADSDYKFIEDEVRLYPLYTKQLIMAKDDIILATPAFDNNGGGRSNLPSSPTESKALTLIDNARIRHLCFYIEAIEQSYNELDDEKQRFVERLFWSKRSSSLEIVASEFNVSLSTAVRWRRAFLYRVATLTGAKRTGSVV